MSNYVYDIKKLKSLDRDPVKYKQEYDQITAEAESIKPMFKDSFNNSTFNKVFDKLKSNSKSDKILEPSALLSTHMPDYGSVENCGRTAVETEYYGQSKVKDVYIDHLNPKDYSESFIERCEREPEKKETPLCKAVIASRIDAYKSKSHMEPLKCTESKGLESKSKAMESKPLKYLKPTEPICIPDNAPLIRHEQTPFSYDYSIKPSLIKQEVQYRQEDRHYQSDLELQPQPVLYFQEEDENDNIQNDQFQLRISDPDDYTFYAKQQYYPSLKQYFPQTTVQQPDKVIQKDIDTNKVKSKVKDKDKHKKNPFIHTKSDLTRQKDNDTKKKKSRQTNY